jgi:diaminohydroxyphosphoribosylaminopyrimidine deaminase/5-amino-6-(5-phosphoribosylamino)uracil reductase
MTSEPMRRALAEAAGVRGTTSPNPWVGAALVRDGRVLTAGATSPPGGPHAEAAALDGIDARGGDLYVTLEPCVAFPGKRTRACCDVIVEAGVRRVVVALEDHDPRVRGAGVRRLREAGIAVEVGDGAEEAARLLRPYRKHRETGLPYVIAKFAASLDGRTATRSGDSRWITGEDSRERVHQERARVDAILAGSGTILADNPALTARPGGALSSHQPVRVVLDSRGRVPADARVFTGAGAAMVATTPAAPSSWKREVSGGGITVVECEPAPGGLNLDQLLQVLGQRGIITAWLEGGATLCGSLLGAGHVDEVWGFVAPVLIGEDGVPAVGAAGPERLRDAWWLAEPQAEIVGRDVLVRGYTGTWRPRD